MQINGIIYIFVNLYTDREREQLKFTYAEDDDDPQTIRMEVASLRPDYLPTLSAAKTSKLSLLVKHHVLAIDEAS